ncbi:unnamed protein product [Chironomus riparius]|uniref:Gustatory receptor n=1 Tax=Chironomus riparius TaxID=315576 RepID=A0A9N9S426_9DIPT|nr:unnamed protein product [Chironomus riparius]
MSQSYLITDVLRNVKLLKILGITFFSVENGKSVTRLQDVLYMLTTIGIGAFICYYSLAYSNDVNSEDSKIASIGNFLVNIASIIIVILSVFITFLFRHKIWFLAQKLDTIELKLRDVGSKMNYNKVMNMYGYACVGVLLIITALEYLSYVLQGSLVQVILDLYSCVYFSINISICTIIILSIALKLKRVNTVCKSMLIHGDYQNSIMKVHTTESNEEIDTIAKIYEIYSICIDAGTTLKLANEMMKQSKDMNKTLILVTFTTLVKKRPPKFTCGLFDFDWKLVFANISSAATNFVILMQFDMASKH